jgi:hypothetical protein
MSNIGNRDREGDKAFRIARQQINTATFVYKRMKPLYRNERTKINCLLVIEEKVEDNTDFCLSATYIKTTHTELIIAQPHNN